MTRSRRRNASPRAYQSQHERIEALEKSRDHWRMTARWMAKKADARSTEIQRLLSERTGLLETASRWATRAMQELSERRSLKTKLHESEQSAHFWRRVAGYSVAACGLILAAAAVFW